MNLFEEKILKQLELLKVLIPEQIQEVRDALKTSSLSFENYLLKKLKVSEQSLLKAKGVASEMPSWALEADKQISKELLRIFPKEAAEQYQMLPVAKKGNALVVGMVNPTDIKSQQALRFILLRSELEPVIVVITEKDFQESIARYKGLKVEVKSALEEMERSLQDASRRTGDVGEYKKTILSEVKETPITKIVAVILKHAIEGTASDIHIEALRANTRIRFRVDGVLYSSLLLPVAIHNSIVARIKILASLRLDESRVPQDGRFNTQVNGKLIDFRVSTFPTSLGEKVVMRVLDPSAIVLEFKELGLIGENLNKVELAIQQPYGMVLVSGPTGSGKTTTLYAALSRVNKEQVNILSLEDPIEYFIEGVSQSQIRPEIDYTFASGLRHMLRQDPDVMMVGEIRDSETAKLATQASLTGHLVFSTIHTNNALGVIPRLTDLGVDSFLLPSSLLISMAQRLVGKLCIFCKQAYVPSVKLGQLINKEIASMPKKVLEEAQIGRSYKIWDAPGCTKCNNKRTKGRIAIFEIFQMTAELKRIVSEEKISAFSLQEEAKRQNMITMKQDGIIKSIQGIVSIQDVLRVVEEEK